MSTLSLRLPKSLHRQLQKLVNKEGISVNQLAATAPAERMAALMTSEYLEQHAQRGSRDKFEDALAKVNNAEPEPRDRP